jgi:hypothetical protein
MFQQPSKEIHMKRKKCKHCGHIGNFWTGHGRITHTKCTTCGRLN